MHIRRTAIIGRGAVGLLYGSLIHRNAGPDSVFFAMDDERYARRRDDRVTVQGDPLAIPTFPMSEAEPVDLVILAVKATGLQDAIDSMHPLVGPRTCILSLLNGITSEERIAERFGWDRVVIGICQGMDAVFLENTLTFTHAGEIRFGAAPQTLPGVAEAIHEFLSRAGIASILESDPMRRMWVKLMLNVGINQTCMAYGGTYGSATEPGSEQNRCFISAMREARAVGRAEGIDLNEDDLSQMHNLIAGLEPTGMPSMAQDRIAHRRTEVEEFSGTIRRLAGAHGILTPCNDWLYKRILEIEASW